MKPLTYIVSSYFSYNFNMNYEFITYVNPTSKLICEPYNIAYNLGAPPCKPLIHVMWETCGQTKTSTDWGFLTINGRFTALGSPHYGNSQKDTIARS